MTVKPMTNASMLALLLALLFGAYMALNGCALLAGPKVQAKTEDGKPIYVTADGQETTQPVAPDGKPNDPVMVYPEDGGVLKQGATMAKGLIPPPWGDLAAGVLTLGATGIGIWARKKNQEARAGRKLIQDIEDTPEVKAVVVEKLASKATPELRALVEKVTG
jgi:hypothetical protein